MNDLVEIVFPPEVSRMILSIVKDGFSRWKKASPIIESVSPRKGIFTSRFPSTAKVPASSPAIPISAMAL